MKDIIYRVSRYMLSFTFRMGWYSSRWRFSAPRLWGVLPTTNDNIYTKYILSFTCRTGFVLLTVEVLGPSSGRSTLLRTIAYTSLYAIVQCRMEWYSSSWRFSAPRLGRVSQTTKDVICRVSRFMLSFAFRMGWYSSQWRFSAPRLWGILPPRTIVD